MPIDERLREGLAANATAYQPALESSLDKVHRRNRMRRVKYTVATGSVAAAVGLLLTVARPDLPDEPTPVQPVPSPDTTSRLFGTYEAQVTTPRRLAGLWVLVFEGNGTIAVTPPPGYAGVVSGTLFAADESTLRTNLFGQDICADLGNGEFSWAKEEDRLNLRATDDPCSQRSRFFTQNDWLENSAP